MKSRQIIRNTERALLQYIFKHESVTRTDLSRATGLSQTSVVRFVNGLRERGLLLETRILSEPLGRGRPSEVLHINPDCGYALGIEFGAEVLVIVLTDAVGKVLHWREVPPPDFTARPATVDALLALAQDTVHDWNVAWPSVRTISLALHDLVTAKGEWIGWSDLTSPPFFVADYLRQKTGLPIHIEDVSRTFAEAEHRYGAGRSGPDVLYITINHRGIGAGIFLNHQLLRTASGICGEIGHIIVDPHGPLCQCGNSGCLVKKVVTGVLVQRFQELLASGMLSTLRGDVPITFEAICAAARHGDKCAYLVLREAAGYLARALATTVNTLGTPTIVIGGPFREAGHFTLNELSSALRQQVIPALSQHIDVQYAQLPEYVGAWGGVLQALAQVWADGEFLPLSEEMPPSAS